MVTSQVNAERLKLLCKHSLSAFIQRSFAEVGNGEYHHTWHIDAMAEYLTACYKRDIKRLIINVPPRSLKSISTTIAFPAWALGHNPKLEIMAASYSQDLSEDHSVACRKIMKSDWYREIFPDTILAADQNQKSKFNTTAGGARRATSVGGTSVGKGFNIGLLDDPLSPLQASSETELKGAINFLQQSWMTRLNNKKHDVSIVVMQRLDEMDPSGFLLSQGGWEHLFLPAVNDIKRTISIGKFTKELEAGEYLDPERMGKETLDQIKIDLGSFAFAGQFMQRPSPEGGGIIKDEWWQHWKGKTPPKTEYVLQVYDTAFTEKTSNDYSARTTWGIFMNEEGVPNLILLERLNKRMEFPELRDEAKASYREYDPDIVLIEEKASGLPLIQEFRRAGLRVRGLKRNANSGDKISRAHNITVLFEQGVIWVPCNSNMVDGKEVWKPKPWAAEVIEQCSVFPNAAHDDLVDTVVDAVAFLRRYKDIKLDSDHEDEPTYTRETGKKKRYY